jgi:Tannase and feruloyl esterase
MKRAFLTAAALLATCGGAVAAPLACDDGIKTAFKPDALTRVVAVKSYKQGDKVFVSDSGNPVTLSNDLCMVKLLVGPGNPGPADARSTSEGIGIEVWLPTHANWNERIRNYGGGGSVGGNHIYADSFGATLDKAVGSKFPAPIIAGMGFASGTTDAGQRWSQNSSFRFLPDGKLNTSLLHDFSYRSLVEQAKKTQALVQLYYGRAQKFAYFDGHSTGGRQVWKIAQDYPELYDGYLSAAPAISTGKFNASAFYPQLVMKADLGYTSADPAFAAANFKAKMTEVNKLAVKSCDKEGLGFLLDPFVCNYNPAKDAAALCTGVAGDGVVGTNLETKTCVNLTEARVINKIWYGATTDGSYDANESVAARSGKALGKTATGQQLWWSYPRGADWGGLISSVGGTEALAVALEDIRYATTTSNLVNPITERERWRALDFAGLADAQAKSLAQQPRLGDVNTDSADLSKLQKLGRKIITYNGLGEEVIPPTVSTNHFERVAASMGGTVEVQKFLRLYLVPAKAHSSQGRAYTVGGNNNAVPLPKLPGGGNQNPTREQDQMFTALQDWVEKGSAPNDIVITSRDNSVSYPICVYPLKITWNGKDSAKVASSYACK